MTDSEVNDYFEYLAKANDMPTDGLDGHISRCINFGIATFWNAADWRFKTRQYSQSITSETEDYELPDDFAGFITVREKENLEGNEITYLTKEEFDARIPKPTAYSTDEPQVFTVFQDGEKWKVRYYPPASSGLTIYWHIVTTPPSSVDKIPSTYTEVVLAACELYFYKLGSPERIAAKRIFENVVMRHAPLDSPYKGMIFKLLDETDIQMEESRPWIDPD